ncbi:MAG TPA: hypothetical protein ENI74_02335, partial [Gammaproteobacteria bacterium]|nr:hypothetical protein [Gammaproteobacteria bacterium]
MNYAAEKHFVSPCDTLPGNAGEESASWNTVSEASIARHDTWLLSFVDILALLLTLFVLLLAFQDREMKLTDVVVPANEGFSTDFTIPPGLLVRQQVLFPAGVSMPDGYTMSGEGFLPAGISTVFTLAQTEESPVPVTPLPDEPPAVPTSSETALKDELIQSQESPQVAAQVLSGPDVVAHESKDPVQALLEVIEDSNLHDRVEVTAHPGEVNLEISDSILFPRGSAELTDEGRVLLTDLAELFGGQPYLLSVEGHTDNIPIETARYPSNWELSSARAAVVTRELIKQGIVPDRVRAIGYGAT